MTNIIITINIIAFKRRCISFAIDNDTTSYFTGWMPFLPPNQQFESAEGIVDAPRVWLPKIVRVDLAQW